MLVTIFDSNGSAVIDSIGAQLISYKDSTGERNHLAEGSEILEPLLPAFVPHRRQLPEQQNHH